MLSESSINFAQLVKGHNFIFANNGGNLLITNMLATGVRPVMDHTRPHVVKTGRSPFNAHMDQQLAIKGDNK